MTDRFTTHAVENQAPPLAPYDLWTSDRALREAVAREGGGWAQAQLAAYGPVAGGELMELGFAANENRPKLRTPGVSMTSRPSARSSLAAVVVCRPLPVLAFTRPSSRSSPAAPAASPTSRTGCGSCG